MILKDRFERFTIHCSGFAGGHLIISNIFTNPTARKGCHNFFGQQTAHLLGGGFLLPEKMPELQIIW
jgi:hypothetical protein